MATILLAAAVGDGDVALGAACSEGAMAIDVGPTYWAIGRKAMEVGSLEERREGEGWGAKRRCLGKELAR